MKNNLLKTIIMLSKCFVYGLIMQTLLLNLVLAVDVKGQYKKIEEVKVTLSGSELTLEQFFKEIQRQTPFKFSYENEDLDQEVSLIFSKKKGAVIDFLMEASIQSNLSFRQVNHGIDVKRNLQLNGKEDSVLRESWISISGKVTDSTGQPIPGVTIIVKGTTIGTVTDLDGNYSISATEGDVLVYSFVGFIPQEKIVSTSTTIDIQLNDDTKSLEEVVVVGYGEQQKVNLTGAISTVKFDDELNNRPITNASQALGGTASGVWVSQNSGKPGADGAQIRVRGWGTLNNSNPLIIIDGVEGTFEQLNPADIENISVLKDAASAAIFGSKAANGVILVTTKMGKTNEKMEVSLNSYGGLQSLGRRYDLVNNSATHMELTNTGLKNDGGSPLFSDALIASFRNGNDPYKYPNTDWFEELFQTAPIQEHNLSIKGGSGRNGSEYKFQKIQCSGKFGIECQ
jgi:TonB-dependent starch-binding outer membrane protein SusC